LQIFGFLLLEAVEDDESKDILEGVDEGKGGILLILEHFDLEALPFEVDDPADLILLLYLTGELPSTITGLCMSSMHSHFNDCLLFRVEGYLWIDSGIPLRHICVKDLLPAPIAAVC
jgi:hypothetical protein